MSIRFFIYLILLLVVFIYGVFSFKKLRTPYKYLTIFIGATFFSEAISRVLIKKLHNSAPGDHIFTVIEYFLISVIYYSLSNNTLFKRALLVGMPVFVIIEIANLIFFQTIFEFPSVMLSVQEMSCVIFSLLFFTEMLLNPVDIALFKQSAFWLNVSIFVFSATVFFCFGLMNSFVVGHLGTKFLDTFIYGLNILFYLFLGLSLHIEVTNQIHATKQ